MITTPRLVLRASRADFEQRLGDPGVCLRIEQAAARYRKNAPAEFQPPAVHWQAIEGLPPHAGLGSGTQLGMAVATVLSLYAGDSKASGVELARRVGRGLRSAVGLHGFLQGGLLIEGGKLSDESISPLVARIAVPADWRWVLIQPRGTEGLSGAAEQQGFAKLPPMPGSTTDRLCRLAMLDLAPALIEADFGKFSDALHAYGQIVGEYFAPVQGGIYADARLLDLAPRLRALGVSGFGQTSWGPTLFALCPDAAAASRLVETLRRDPACTQCDLTIAEPLNHGATVAILE